MTTLSSPELTSIIEPSPLAHHQLRVPAYFTQSSREQLQTISPRPTFCIYRIGFISSALIHILISLLICRAFFSSPSETTAFETASFIELISLDTSSSAPSPMKHQSSLAVKDSSKSLPVNKLTVHEQHSDPKAQLRTTTPVKPQEQKALHANAQGVGFDAAQKQGAITASYQDAIVSRLERFKRYPQRALQRHLEGEVLLGLTLNQKGEAIDSRIITSSGFSFFDDEVIAMAKKASPFHVPASSGENATFRYQIPISFKLR